MGNGRGVDQRDMKGGKMVQLDCKGEYRLLTKFCASVNIFHEFGFIGALSFVRTDVEGLYADLSIALVSM